LSFPRLRSLRSQLLLAGLLFQCLLLAGYFLVTSSVLRDGMRDNLQVAARQTAEIINLAVAAHASDGRLSELQDFFRELIGDSSDGLTYLLIEDERGQRLLTAGRLPSGPLPEADRDTLAALDRGILHQRQALLLNDNQVGLLQFGLATNGLLGVLEHMLRLVLLLNLGALVIASLAISLFSRRLGKRLKNLMSATNALAAGDYQSRVREQGHDELTRLADNFNRMAEAVTVREKKFAGVFNAAPLPMLLLRQQDSQLHLEQSNSAALEAFGELPEDLLQTPTDAWQAVHQALASSSAEQPSVALEVSLPQQDGSPHQYLLSTRHFDLPDARLQILALTDIATLRAAQQALQNLNASLEQRIAARTSELAGRNQELANALEHLQQVQEQLVQADKLASLGSIVAAVAHELNTPIGNALTVASTLQEHSRAFSQAIEQGLRRSMLESFQHNSQEAAEMLIRNLERAAELIRSFKGVAVDRTSSQRRQFDLAGVIEETLLTLQPTLKPLPYRISHAIPTGIRLDSYPGPLGQILSNLINNAIVHAFAGRDHGQMHLQASLNGPDRLQLRFSDDGCGIAHEHLKRIFDPFFTTRLGQGGSGLGLNIVYNLATGVLGGSIHAESALGQGSTFILDIPLHAPTATESLNV
jgi:signal transduction histidine kinase